MKIPTQTSDASAIYKPTAALNSSSIGKTAIIGCEIGEPAETEIVYPIQSNFRTLYIKAFEITRPTGG
jgi:hypothetical protein